MMKEQKFAEKIEAWLRRYYPKKTYHISTNVNQPGADIKVKKKEEEPVILQIDTKLEDFYDIIGQGFYRLWEGERKVPTFIAVPYSKMKRRDWDFKVFISLFKYFEVEIGVLVLYENDKVKVEYNPWRASVRFK
jgi:hypothetical protein